jgi:hypothetical protein
MSNMNEQQLLETDVAANGIVVGDCKLMFGDCLERMKEIPDGSVDMILCDLPYGTVRCKWDTVIQFDALWEQYKRAVKPSGAILLFAAQPFTSSLGASNLDMLKYTWYWRKSRPSGHLNAKKMPLKDVEDILVFYSKPPTYNPQGTSACSIVKKNTEGRLNAEVYGSVQDKDHLQTVTGYPRQVLDFASVHNVGTDIHPTQKPVSLCEYLIMTYTNEGETVLDNTMGSGTTLVAAINTGRKAIGIEMDKGYFDIAAKRIAEAQTNKEIQ